MAHSFRLPFSIHDSSALRRLSGLTLICLLCACSSGTPPCTDETVVAAAIQRAVEATSASLRQNDPDIRTSEILTRLQYRLTDIVATDHDKSIDKHSCTGNLRITLPDEIAALKTHRAFWLFAVSGAEVEVHDNEIVAPISFSSYLSEKEKMLIVNTEGERAAAKFIQSAHKAGAFDADLTALPDLHAGLTLFKAEGKHLLMRPNEIGGLEFHMTYDNPVCRPWTQVITEEKGSVLRYDNPEVGCSVTFSRLGEMLVVEHDGCEPMMEACFPDGIYQKQ